jgi:phosphatidylserine decarboxylase
VVCTPSGFDIFRNGKFNLALQEIFLLWCEFLSSDKSRAFLNTDEPSRWPCKTAWTTLGLDEFEVDLSLPFGGFDSWNSFFIRKFKPGARPVAPPDDEAVVANACESRLFNLQHRVKLIVDEIPPCVITSCIGQMYARATSLVTSNMEDRRICSSSKKQ